MFFINYFNLNFLELFYLFLCMFYSTHVSVFYLAFGFQCIPKSPLLSIVPTYVGILKSPVIAYNYVHCIVVPHFCH